MATAEQTAEAFFDAWTSGRFDEARALLHDDVDFRGPIDTFDSAEPYVQALQGLSQIVKAAEKRKVFVDGDDVCVIYDLVTDSPAGTAPVAEWYRVRDGKIAAVRVFFDARPFAAMMGR